MRLRSGERTLFDAETGISLAENPTVRIASEQNLKAPLTLEAVDSKNERYEATCRENRPESRRRVAARGQVECTRGEEQRAAEPVDVLNAQHV